MAQKQRNDLIDRLQYVGLRLASVALHCFPVDTNLRTAALIGDLIYWISPRRRQRIRDNLRRSFPGMSEAERDRVGRQSMRGLILLGVDLIFSTRLIHLETWNQYVELENFREVVSLLVREKGLILLTGHYGNWEILGYVLAVFGFETTSIARPLDNPYINDWVLGVREKRGQKIIDKKGATTDIVPLLSRGGAVAFIADQNAGTKGVFVDFFGRKASTYKSIGLLAMEYQIPVVIGYARRKGGGFRFQVGVQDIIYPADWKDQDDPLRYITQRYTKGIEDFVRADPGQYLWVHRRWKTRPKGEEPETSD